MIPAQPAQSTRVVRSTRVVLPGGVRPAAILIRNGVIADVLPPGADLPRDAMLTDVGSAVVLPGLVDTHVHVNEPGRTDWEGFATATRAAAAGGITALVDMPLNSIPATTSVAALEQKRAAAQGQCHIDVGFWGGVVPGNAAALEGLVKAGALGFKCFLIDSGVAEFQHVVEGDLRAALPILARLGVPLLTHAELEGPIARVAQSLDVTRWPKDSYQSHLMSRPKAAENEAVELMVGLCRKTRARVHIVHHASSEALPTLAQARSEGLPLTVETCPHYLSFAAEDIPNGATWFKCTPPIRERDNQTALWAALRAGVIDAVVSDHSPCSVALKNTETGDFSTAWGGIASLQVTLSATFTGALKSGLSSAEALLSIAKWMSAEPARLAGLTKKGALAKGNDADLVVFDDAATLDVDQARLFHKNKLTPYHHLGLRGVVRETWLRGERIFAAPAALGAAAEASAQVVAPRGRFLVA